MSFLSVMGLEICDKRIKAKIRSGDGAGDHAARDDVVGIVVRKVEAEKAGFAKDGNDLALLAEDRLIGERISEGESGTVIILKGAKHFRSGDDLDPGAGFIAGEERGHEESPALEKLVKRDERSGVHVDENIANIIEKIFVIEMIVLLFVNGIIDKHIGDFTVIRNNSAVEGFRRNVNRGGIIGRNEPDKPVKINLSAGGNLDIRYHGEHLL